MIKHYVKPGITGLAQIKGFRGDTSIEARIHEDIDYIEHWSFWLDLYVLFKTPFKALNKNEKYVAVGKEGDEQGKDEPEISFIPMESDVLPKNKNSAESADNPDDTDMTPPPALTEETSSSDEVLNNEKEKSNE